MPTERLSLYISVRTNFFKATGTACSQLSQMFVLTGPQQTYYGGKYHIMGANIIWVWLGIYILQPNYCNVHDYSKVLWERQELTQSWNGWNLDLTQY